MTRLAIIGVGYVGLVTGACLAELGHTITCIEIDPDRLAKLRRGECPIHEPGLPELLVRNRDAGRLRFTDSYADAIPGSEAVFLAVPTPAAADGQADTSYVFRAVDSLLSCAEPGTIVVTKSTVPVGTGDAIEAMVAARGLTGVHVAANPEFLREGSAVHDFMRPDRIVIGADSNSVQQKVAALYAPLEANIICCSRRAAELGKYAANALLATRISFMNEISIICEASAVDVQEVARIVGQDSRIGPAFLQAGLGWGGSCFPKDVRALAVTAAALGCDTPILDAVESINARQRQRAFAALRDAVGDRTDGTVAVLGLAFKPNTDDVRESPALDVIGRLLEEGIRVRAHDPVAIANAKVHLPQVTYCDDIYETVRHCDAVLVATEWREYLMIDWHRVSAVMRGRTIVDGRNVLSPATLVGTGLEQLAFGQAPERRQGHQRTRTPAKPPEPGRSRHSV
ncbi:MAG: UDP-glucose dehydrogenase family protein [Dehalococcoidia bacterium]